LLENDEYCIVHCEDLFNTLGYLFIISKERLPPLVNLIIPYGEGLNVLKD